MGKNFNSFSELIKGRSESGFKSFKDLASKISTVPGAAPVQENIETPQVDLNIEVDTQEDKSVVSNLIEKLLESDDSSQTPINESLSQAETDLPLEGKNLEEALATLIKRIDGLSTGMPVTPEVLPEPVKEARPEEPNKAYRVFRDIDETFECNLTVEGTSLANSKVRLVLESDAWNFVFYGKVYGDGKCVVPIKKGIPLVEGATGKIKLEVIAEEQLFIGWEDNFKIAASKKVKVDLKEQKAVKVSFNKPLNEKG
jgi:hypothetical protein